jgi:predicted ATP-grasp superfamily ATP-dependent carboligase
VRLSQQAIEGVPDLLGYFGVDLLLADTAETDAPDVAVEINPRLTTSYLGLRALSRKNLVTMMLALARGDPILPAWKPGNVEFTPDGQLRWLAR